MRVSSRSSISTDETARELPLGGSFRLVKEFTSSAVLFENLMQEFSFEQRSIVLFGRSVVQPRLIAWAGDHPYTYSGDRLEPQPFPSSARKLLDHVNAFMAAACPEAPHFNHVLANLYRNGSDSMGLHADDERELGDAPFIASLSLGAERYFQIVPKKKYRHQTERATKQTLLLPSGSLLIMCPPMQRYYLHGIQKTKHAVEPRLNLTFRSIDAT